ncbi:hypothetical protein H2199_000478 [Coniosporium tulheliwenetii]|uniref:Uncharacterized protein n=1 Tax=Coniosporium tulheliwenetii TaxID=3383036 RepID=A0ACC2ZQF9_9PEZI|nr:hypothetical protein H2199_000478 [Cladosporium sp. JES 115]
MSQTIGRTRLAYSRTWHRIDVSADPRPLGRIASQIAIALMGKHKPIFDPSTDCGDYVVAVGPGSLKEISMQRMFEKWGVRLERLKVFEGHAHPYKQNVVKLMGRRSIGALPEVRAQLEEAKVAAQK